MSKKTKNENLSKKGNYNHYPFNMVLRIYVDSEVNKLKIANQQKKKRKKELNKEVETYRQAYKQEVYAALEKATGVDWDTIKKYYLGTSTPSIKQYNVYTKFAKVFKCKVVDIVPKEYHKDFRLVLLKQIGIDEESYNEMSFKNLPSLLKDGEYLENTYSKIINYLIHQKSFLNTFEKEIDENIGELLHIKKYNDHTKKMSYKEFIQYIQEIEDKGKLNMGDKPIPSFNETKDNIVRAFRGVLNAFIENLFEDDKGE
ncbi:MAG: hypothetical protein IJK18_04395 [Clostridia bacterium]|nr:hypothetical protein [Clostridia bacterium]